MKPGSTIGVVPPTAAGTAMMLAVAAAAGGQVQLGCNQKDWNQVTPEEDSQNEIGQGAPHR